MSNSVGYVKEHEFTQVGSYQPSSIFTSDVASASLVYDFLPCHLLTSRQSYIELARKGVPGEWVKKIVDKTGLRELFMAILGVSSGNLSRIYRRKSLSREQSEEVLDTIRLLHQANTVWESEALASQWLASPVVALSGEKPINLLDTFEGRKWVSQVLDHIEQGDFS